MTGLLGPAEIRELAARLGVAPTKKLGQNFVHDPNTVRRIVTAAGLTPDDVALEVGPGLGSLTLALLPVAAHVHAVEIDPALAGALPETVARHAGPDADRLTVHRADALRITAAELADPAPTALVANLPYNVAVPVVLHLLAELPSLRHGLVMVQKEVADRLVAGPGSKVYGIPSVKLAWYAARPRRRQGAAERVLAGAQRRLRPGRLHPPGAAPRRRAPASGSSRWSTRRSRSAARRCAPRWPAGPAAPDRAAAVAHRRRGGPGRPRRVARPSSSSPPIAASAPDRSRRPPVGWRRCPTRRRGADRGEAVRHPAAPAGHRPVTEAWRPDDEDDRRARGQRAGAGPGAREDQPAPRGRPAAPRTATTS